MSLDARRSCRSPCSLPWSSRCTVSRPGCCRTAAGWSGSSAATTSATSCSWPRRGPSGRLSYADQSYPRAWHTLVAAVWRAAGGRLDAAGLSSLVDVMASLSWLLPAVLVVATATLTTSLGLTVGLGRRPAAWAAVLASSALLLPVFLGNYQALGFENSYVAAIVTTVAARELVGQRAGLAALVVCGAGAVVCAHAWQLLLPGAGLALGVVSWRLVRGQRTVARVVPVLLVWVVGLVVAWPALVALLGDIGLGHATDSDIEAPYSVLLVVTGLATSVGLAVAVRRARLWGFAALVGLPAVTALALVMAVGVGIGDYYPSKLLWHTSALGLAATAVAGALVAARAASGLAPRVRPVAKAAVGAVGGLFLLLAAVSPLGAFVGAWSTAHGSVVRAAITTPGAAEAQVAWLGSAGDDTIGRILLDFYRVPTTSERTPQPLLDREEECALLLRRGPTGRPQQPARGRGPRSLRLRARPQGRAGAMSGRLPPAAWLHVGLAVVGAVATVVGLWAVAGATLVWLVAGALAGRAGQAPWHLPTAWVLVVAATSAVALGADVLGLGLLSHTAPTRALVACTVLGAGGLCAARMAPTSVEAAPGDRAGQDLQRRRGAGRRRAAPRTAAGHEVGAVGHGWRPHPPPALRRPDRARRRLGLRHGVLPACVAHAAGHAGRRRGRRPRTGDAAAPRRSDRHLHLDVVRPARHGDGGRGRPLRHRARHTQRHRAWAGALAGWLVLWPTVSVDYLGFGFQTSVLAATVLAVVVGECVRAPGSTRSVVVAVVATGLMCHVWQLLVPVAGLAALLAVAAWFRARRRSRQALTALVVGSGVALVYAAPALTAVLGVGLDHATDAGLDPRVPWVWALLGLPAATALLLRTWRGAGSAPSTLSVRLPALVVGATTASTAVLGLALAARFGLSPLTYYPGKLLWHSAVLGMVALPAGVLFLLRSAGRPATVAVVPVLASVVVGLGLVAPVYALTGRLSNVDADLVLAAARTPAADRAQVVWLSGTEYDDLVTRVLLRHDDARIDPTGRSDSYPSRAEECALLEASARPAVLSDRSEAEVQARYSCVLTRVGDRRRPALTATRHRCAFWSNRPHMASTERPEGFPSVEPPLRRTGVEWGPKVKTWSTSKSAQGEATHDQTSKSSCPGTGCRGGGNRFGVNAPRHHHLRGRGDLVPVQGRHGRVVGLPCRGAGGVLPAEGQQLRQLGVRPGARRHGVDGRLAHHVGVGLQGQPDDGPARLGQLRLLQHLREVPRHAVRARRGRGAGVVGELAERLRRLAGQRRRLRAVPLPLAAGLLLRQPAPAGVDGHAPGALRPHAERADREQGRAPPLRARVVHGRGGHRHASRRGDALRHHRVRDALQGLPRHPGHGARRRPHRRRDPAQRVVRPAGGQRGPEQVERDERLRDPGALGLQGQRRQRLPEGPLGLRGLFGVREVPLRHGHQDLRPVERHLARLVAERLHTVRRWPAGPRGRLRPRPAQPDHRASSGRSTSPKGQP